MIVINFFAGPGSGKSTTSAYVFARFKNDGIKAELAREVAKDFIWEGREAQLSRNQALVAALQYAKLKDLQYNGCEVAITDSPLSMQLVYSTGTRYHNELAALIHKFDEEFHNIKVFLKRTKPYVQFGRYQDEAGAKALDQVVFDASYPYHLVAEADQNTQEQIYQKLKGHIENVRKVESELSITRTDV